MIKAIIFDWGEVLEIIRHKDFLKEIKQRYNIKDKTFEKVEFEGRVKMCTKEITPDQHLETMKKLFGVKLTTEEWFNLFFKKYVTLNEELIDLAKKLKKNYRVFMLSNCETHVYEHIKNETELEHIFEKLVMSFQEGVMKPDPKIYLKVIEGTDLKPEECIYIDDNEKYTEGGRKVGFHVILHKSNEKTIEKLKELGVKL